MKMGGCESKCKNDMGSCQMRRCQGEKMSSWGNHWMPWFQHKMVAATSMRHCLGNFFQIFRYFLLWLEQKQSTTCVLLTNHMEKHFHIIDDMNWWNSTSIIGAGRAGSPMTWVRREIHGSISNKNGTIFCLLPNSEKKAKDHAGHAEEAELAQSVVIEAALPGDHPWDPDCAAKTKEEHWPARALGTGHCPVVFLILWRLALLQIPKTDPHT